MATDNPTKIPEMVERVAWTIAIWTRGMSPAQWENAGMERKPYYRAALEVLKAIREPTLGMVRCGALVVRDSADTQIIQISQNVWRAMAEEALNEKYNPLTSLEE